MYVVVTVGAAAAAAGCCKSVRVLARPPAWCHAFKSLMRNYDRRFKRRNAGNSEQMLMHGPRRRLPPGGLLHCMSCKPREHAWMSVRRQCSPLRGTMEYLLLLPSTGCDHEWLVAANRGEGDGISGGLRAAFCVVKTVGRCKGWSWGLQLDVGREQKGMVSDGLLEWLCTSSRQHKNGMGRTAPT